jgi:hypothetical protein
MDSYTVYEEVFGCFITSCRKKIGKVMKLLFIFRHYMVSKHTIIKNNCQFFLNSLSRFIEALGLNDSSNLNLICMHFIIMQYIIWVSLEGLIALAACHRYTCIIPIFWNIWDRRWGHLSTHVNHLIKDFLLNHSFIVINDSYS